MFKCNNVIYYHLVEDINYFTLIHVNKHVDSRKQTHWFT